MVYRKTYRKRTYKKKPWYNKKYSTLDIAKKAWYATKYLKGLVNSEMLHKDTTFTLGSNQNAIFAFTAIAQGDDDGARTGNSILLRSLYIRGRITINSAVTNYSRVSMLLVKDKQQVADTAPAIGDIVKTATDPDTFLATGTLGRFKVLWRKTFTPTVNTAGRPGIDFNKYWKVQDHVRYNGTTSADIQRNGYYLVVITDEATNYPTVVINARVGYHDN